MQNNDESTLGNRLSDEGIMDSRGIEANGQVKIDSDQGGANVSQAFLEKHQTKLVPFNKLMLILLGGYFLLVSTWQLSVLNDRVEWKEATVSIKSANQSSALSDKVDFLLKKAPAEENFAVVQTLIYADLERSIVARRYHQANMMLMSRIWIQYLSFLTGMILSVLGAVFILNQMRTPEAKAVLEAKELGGFSFNAASPGIVLSFLGCVIICFSLGSSRNIDMKDQAIYPVIGFESDSTQQSSAKQSFETYRPPKSEKESASHQQKRGSTPAKTLRIDSIFKSSKP